MLYGDVAQLGEHLFCKQKVVGSIPIISTTGYRKIWLIRFFWKEETVSSNLTTLTSGCDGIGIRACLRNKILWVQVPPSAPNYGDIV